MSGDKFFDSLVEDFRTAKWKDERDWVPGEGRYLDGTRAGVKAVQVAVAAKVISMNMNEVAALTCIELDKQIKELTARCAKAENRLEELDDRPDE